MTDKTEWKKEILKVRFEQACDEISDESVFTPDQIIKLQNAFLMMRWGLEDALVEHPAPADASA